MLINNKYLKWYFNIIKNAKLRKNNNVEYIEYHHIIPRCFNGSNCKENLVALTAKEHFICHLLLPKFTTGIYKRKMIHSAFMFTRSSSNQQRYKITSRWYSILKENMANIQRGIKKGPHTKEWSQNISKAKKGKPLTDAHKMALTGIKKGRPWSEARRKACRQVMTPCGVFNSMAEAERGNRVGANVIAYRINTQPDLYYFVDTRTNSGYDD